ncbi:hypothetical protein CRM22_006224 [Opisthorchis felineus]|uniref:Uncharacterized protein n=1 Tax=Opisthorchis felineus TaxID=147828 RepID=A0A4S2LTE3_OPIFE|nr:hypothetical protein CRM22_006224 [Opisthorchis felineus]
MGENVQFECVHHAEAMSMYEWSNMTARGFMDDGGDVSLTAVILTALCSVTIILLLIVCLLMGLRKMQAIQKLLYPPCSSNSSIVKIPETCSNPASQTTSRLVRSVSTPAGFQNTSSAHLPRSTNHNWMPYVIQSIPQQNGQTYTTLWQISSNQPLTKPVAIRLVGVNGTDVQIGSRMGLVSRGIRTSNTIQNLLPSTSIAELKSDKNLTAPQKDFTPNWTNGTRMSQAKENQNRHSFYEITV